MPEIEPIGCRFLASPHDYLMLYPCALTKIGLAQRRKATKALDRFVYAIGYRLSAIGYRLSVIGYRLSAIGYRLSAIGYRLSATGYRLLATGDWLLWRVLRVRQGGHQRDSADAVAEKRGDEEVHEKLAEAPLPCEDHVQRLGPSRDDVSQVADADDVRDDDDNPQPCVPGAGQQPDHRRDQKAGVDAGDELRGEAMRQRFVA